MPKSAQTLNMQLLKFVHDLQEKIQHQRSSAELLSCFLRTSLSLQGISSVHFAAEVEWRISEDYFSVYPHAPSRVQRESGNAKILSHFQDIFNLSPLKKDIIDTKSLNGAFFQVCKNQNALCSLLVRSMPEKSLSAEVKNLILQMLLIYANAADSHEAHRQMRVKNDLLSILCATTNSTEALTQVASLLFKLCVCDRVVIANSVNRQFQVLIGVAQDEGEIVPIASKDLYMDCPQEIVHRISPSHKVNTFLTKNHKGLSICLPRVFIAGVYNGDYLDGFLTLEYNDPSRKLNSFEKNIVIIASAVIENLILRDNVALENQSFSNYLEEKVKERTDALKIMTDEAQRAKTNAENAMEAKSGFLTNMSHEIRTPMNSILGVSELLLEEPLDEKSRHYVRNIRNSSKTLLTIINDILDMSRIETGKLEIVPSSTNLLKLLEKTAQQSKPYAKAKGLELTCNFDIPEELYIFADEQRLEQVLSNLLSNGIKFTREGHVIFTAAIVKNRVVFDVIDTGIGIKDEDLPHIFSSFERTDVKKSGIVAGTGLGLAIAKNLIDLMDGTLTVTSTYGSGSCFHVEIPFQISEKNQTDQKQLAQAKMITAPEAQILVVDDIQSNLMVAAGMLEICGINADTALSGAVALTMTKNKSYDIIFMDHMMPEMDGIETMQAIRSLGHSYQNLPIIALTANTEAGAKETMLNLGMNDFITKPLEKSALVQMLIRWLPPEKIELVIDGAYPQLAQSISPTLKEIGKIGSIDIPLALERISGLSQVLESAIKQLAASLDTRLLKMENDLNDGNLKSFAVDIHGLKGSLANIGASSPSDTAFALEKAAKSGDLPYCRKYFPNFSLDMRVLEKKLTKIFGLSKPETVKKKTVSPAAAATKKIVATISALDMKNTSIAVKNMNDLLEENYSLQINEVLEDALALAEKEEHLQAARRLAEVRRFLKEIR